MKRKATSKKPSNSRTQTTSAIARLGLISTEIRDPARLQAIAEYVEMPLSRWPGNCYAVAHALCESGLLEGVAQYGHWRGPVSEQSMFYGRWEALGWANHGWVVMSGEFKGLICDPTRYVFEDVEPYVFMGVDTYNYYDACGDHFRQRRESAAPPYDPRQKRFELTLPPDTAAWIERRLMRVSPLSLDQIIWLGNLSIATLGNHAGPVYRALIDAGMRAVIPLDNRELVLNRR